MSLMWQNNTAPGTCVTFACAYDVAAGSRARTDMRMSLMGHKNTARGTRVTFACPTVAPSSQVAHQASDLVRATPAEGHAGAALAVAVDHPALRLQPHR